MREVCNLVDQEKRYGIKWVCDVAGRISHKNEWVWCVGGAYIIKVG